MSKAWDERSHLAPDRLANTSYRVAIEGSSYRERLSSHRALLGPKEVTDL